MKRGTAIIGGERVDFEWNAEANTIEATVGRRAYSLETKEIRRGVYWFAWNGQSIEAAVTEAEEGYSVSILGHHVPVEFLDARKALRRAAHADHDGVAEVRAPMPGKIVRVLVSEGADVEAQQGLVVMEAMKMQNEIRSPKRGKIRKLEVKEGDTVNGAALIAQVE
jgi:biotin carboxyl carrier protein